MSRTASELLREALDLSQEDRADLINSLIESFDSETDANVEDAWIMEVNRRTEELDRGAVKAIPWPDVLRKLSSDLK